MVPALLTELLPVLFPKCRFSLIKQVPSNSELSEPEAALNEGFLNKSTCIQHATKTQDQNNPDVLAQGTKLCCIFQVRF